MSQDILDVIDHAIAEVGVSGDAMRWTPEPREDHVEAAVYVYSARIVRQPTPEEVERLRVALTDVARLFNEQLAPVIRAYRAVAAEWAKQLRAAGVIPPPPPAHPMLRAIEAKRNRNTGPTVVLRPPLRIDPRRGR